MGKHFRPIQLIPAAEGTKALYLVENGYLEQRVIAWALGEWVSFDDGGLVSEDEPPGDYRDHDMVGMIMMDRLGLFEPARQSSNFWRYLLLGDPVPSPEEAIAERQERQQREESAAHVRLRLTREVE